MTTTMLLDTEKLVYPQPKAKQTISIRVSFTPAEHQQAHQVAKALGLSLNETIRRLLAQAAEQLEVPG